ncbi:MAG: sigma-70 family RNA polymerase sigma factor [Acidobacteria bacterium]|nr:sigma-70 family RNA polymerase sigma factor [Acidobacteriota bacterium]
MTETATEPAGQDLVGLPADEAIPRLLDQEGGRVYKIALRLCGSPEDAADLVQDVFLQAYRKWHQFQGDSQPSTWLYTIAARACRRTHRRRAGEPARLESLDELLPHPEAGIPDLRDGEDGGPLSEHLKNEARELVERAVAELPDGFRLPLVLKEILELPVGEVAAILGIKEATVKTRLHRARLMLRRAVSEGLPQRSAPHPHHSRRVCLDLLAAKQEALDRGVPFRVPPEEVCSRCEALFDTLDLTQQVCLELREGELPAPLRRAVLDAFPH